MWLPLTRPLLGTWSSTQAHALTGNRTSDPLVHRLAFSPLSHTSQGGSKISKACSCLGVFACGCPIAPELFVEKNLLHCFAFVALSKIIDYVTWVYFRAFLSLIYLLVLLPIPYSLNPCMAIASFEVQCQFSNFILFLSYCVCYFFPHIN